MPSGKMKMKMSRSKYLAYAAENYKRTNVFIPLRDGGGSKGNQAQCQEDVGVEIPALPDHHFPGDGSSLPVPVPVPVPVLVPPPPPSNDLLQMAVEVSDSLLFDSIFGDEEYARPHVADASALRKSLFDDPQSDAPRYSVACGDPVDADGLIAAFSQAWRALKAETSPVLVQHLCSLIDGLARDVDNTVAK